MRRKTATPQAMGVCFGLLAAAALSACGGSDAPIASSAALVRLEAESAGTNCLTGGIRVLAGNDINGDGTLDVAEVTSIQFVCNGAPGPAGATGSVGPAGQAGSEGLATLVLMSNEPAGANCSNGGKKISAGRDANGDGVLDPNEIASTAYVCNGSNGSNGTSGINGTNGTNGANGINTLVAMTSEPAGANCTYGGKKISSGLDSNANGVLDAGEVTATSYLCDGAPGATGATGATGPAGPGLTWVDVTGTTAQAQSNTGYLADNTAQVVITLPAAPAIGDVVRVSGVGSGGWMIALQPGQSIITAGIESTTIGAVWTARESVRNWGAVASSADGRKLVAAEWPGQIYTSTDSGLTWTARESNRNWNAVASSADGAKLVATEYGGRIYTSNDSGLTWTAHDSNRNWYGVASSADGTKLAATVWPGQIYTSSDSGLTWTARESSRRWIVVASSADGAKLAAVVYGGQIYTSTDSGVTWTARNSNRGWFAVASSADGPSSWPATMAGRSTPPPIRD